LLAITLFFTQNLDLVEYIKSFLLTAIMLFVYISSLNRQIHSNIFSLSKIIAFVSLVIVTFEITQILEFYFLGTSNSWFILDSFSISTATDISRFQAVNFLSFMRPISVFHEPSYLGIILLVLLICGHELKVNKSILLIIYIGITISFSTTALIFMILYVIAQNLNRFKNVLAIIFLISFVSIFLIDEESLNSIFRLGEILNSGTSGNERLIGPYEYLIDQIFNKKHYFGIPLGQSELIFNNSFYLLFLYFGLVTPLILGVFISFIFYKYKFESFKYLIAFFALLFLNGAIFTLESALILYCLNYSFGFKLHNNSKSVIVES
jgi:hypothetical protein